MSESGISNKEQLAAEFVLGTLETSERSRVHAERLSDPELDAFILAWETRLLPLSEQIEDASPPANVLQAIEATLDGLETMTSAPIAGSPGSDVSISETLITSLQQRLNRWRQAAIAGFAMASLFLALWLWPSANTTTPFVAVFQQDDQQPAFIMNVDLESRIMKIQAISAQGVAGRTYQLWIKADPLGPNPQSLGLVETVSAPIQKRLDKFEPGLLRHATFGISVEPPGGSPTGVPTGPAIHGYLYPTDVGI